MGMYTELNLGVALRPDTPDEILDLIHHMVCLYDECDPDIKIPDHPLFLSPRWRYMLHSDSYSFEFHAESSMKYDRIRNGYTLNIRCSFKNYDNEIENFLDFIQPYLDEAGYMGYMRYEEYEDPTLIYNEYDHIGIYAIPNMRLIKNIIKRSTYEHTEKTNKTSVQAQG